MEDHTEDRMEDRVVADRAEDTDRLRLRRVTWDTDRLLTDPDTTAEGASRLLPRSA